MASNEEKAKQENKRYDSAIKEINEVIKLYEKSIDELDKNKGYPLLENIKSKLKDKKEQLEAKIVRIKRDQRERLETAKKKDIEEVAKEVNK